MTAHGGARRTSIQIRFILVIEGACLFLVLMALLVALARGSSSPSANGVVTSGDVALAFKPPMSYFQDGVEVLVEHRQGTGSSAPLPLLAPSPTEAETVEFQVTQHAIFKLAGAKLHQDAIVQCSPEISLRVGAVPDDGGPIEVTAEGIGRVGIITARHGVAKALRAGESVLHASISSCSPPSSKADGALRVRVVTGAERPSLFPLKVHVFPIAQAGPPACVAERQATRAMVVAERSWNRTTREYAGSPATVAATPAHPDKGGRGAGLLTR